MNEPQFASKVKLLLNEGTVKTDTLHRLKQARAEALKHQRVSRPAPALAWVESLVTDFGGFTGFSLRLVLPMAVLVGGLVAINGWQQNLRVAEVEEIDALLLTDDLPLDAYLDKGFEAWLKKRTP
jgi:hypothetical protein